MKQITEKEFAERLELPRQKLMALRRFKLKLADPDVGKDGATIIYFQSGISKIVTWLRDEGALTVNPIELLNGNGTHKFVVSRVLPNVHLLDVVDEDGTKCRLWVKSNKNFVAKMEVQGRPKKHWPDNYFEIVGKYPRRRGRW